MIILKACRQVLHLDCGKVVMMFNILKPFFFLIFLFFTDFKSFGQNVPSKLCDSAVLSKQELDKCLRDTIWDADIAKKIQYITILKKGLLPRYRTIRKKLILPEELQNALLLLKKKYDSVLNYKLSVILFEMDKNQKYVQPKAFISSMLSLQTFRFYPDIYAILLNDIHLILSPKTSIDDFNSYHKQVEEVSNSISTELKNRLETITTSFYLENEILMKGNFIPQFQGGGNQEVMKNYRIINFLLWRE